MQRQNKRDHAAVILRLLDEQPGMVRAILRSHIDGYSTQHIAAKNGLPIEVIQAVVRSVSLVSGKS